MAEVYQARDSKLSRDVAIKVLPAALATTPHDLSRLEKEACMASAFRHPNIVSVYEISRIDGVSFIAMELVRGEDSAPSAGGRTASAEEDPLLRGAGGRRTLESARGRYRPSGLEARETSWSRGTGT
jgi:hypothetical protein